MKLVFLTILFSVVVFANPVTKVYTNVTTTTTQTVTIIAPKKKPPVVKPPKKKPPVVKLPKKKPPVVKPPKKKAPVVKLPTHKIVSTVYIKSSLINTNVVTKEANTKMVYNFSFDKPLPADLKLQYRIIAIDSGFKVKKDIKQPYVNYITLKKGSTSGKVEIDVLDDKLKEKDERFWLRLRLPNRYFTYDNGTKKYNYKYFYAKGIILDNKKSLDIKPSIIDKSVTVDESKKKMVYHISFDKPLPKDFKLQYVVIAIDSGFKVKKDIKQSSMNYITVKKGSTTAKIELDVVDDHLIESDERFKLRLRLPIQDVTYDNGSEKYNYKYFYAQGTIIDNEISLTINNYLIFTEDEANTKKMNFNIALSHALTSDLKINYYITPGKNLAIAGKNKDIVVPKTKYIIIPKGKKNINLDIGVIDDTLPEEAEYFYITIKNPKIKNITLLNSKSLGIILDDDTKIDIPKNKGDYYIYEHNTLDSKIKTKIVGNSSKLDVVASKGFSVYTGKKAVKSKKCGAPVCSISTIKGNKVKTCTTDCTIVTKILVTYNDNMNIDKIILHDFKKYDEATKTCSAENTKLLGKHIHITSGAKYTFNLPLTNAYRCNWVEVLGHSEKDANTSKVKKFKGVSDPFAIRPDRFSVDLKGYNFVNPLKAEQKVDFAIKALDIKGNKVNSYSQKNYHESLTDAKFGNSLSKGLDLNGLSFSSGEIKKQLTYNDVGELTIKVEEKAPYFAQIDKNDNPSTIKISPATYKLKVVPDHFDISANIVNANPTNNFTLFANNLSNMASSLSYTIFAKGKNNTTLTRYDKGSYAKNIDVNITQNITSDNSRNMTLLYQNSKGTGNKAFKTTDTKVLNFKLNSSDFSTGTASDKVLENFQRTINLAQNPLILNTKKISVKDSDNVVGQNPINKKATFYYARTHVPSPQSAVGKTLKSQMYYEVYCKGCTKSTFIEANNKSSEDDIYWYELPNSNVNNFSLNNLDFSNPIANNGATAIKINRFEIKTTAPTVPYSSRVYYLPISFLQYNRFAFTIPVKHYFDTNFLSSNSRWAGEGNLGKTVDTDISVIKNKSLEY